jgi:hypothetical protein
MVFAKLNTIDSIENKKRFQSCSQFIQMISAEMTRQMTADEARYCKAFFYGSVV